jgi:hypothetical protein
MKTLPTSSGISSATPQERARARRLLKLYKISPEQADAMFASQGNKCKICGRRPKKVRLNIDHDHEAEKVRGVLIVRGGLCGICNHKILGMIERFKVSPEAIVAYIRSKPAFIDGKET